MTTSVNIWAPIGDGSRYECRRTGTGHKGYELYDKINDFLYPCVLDSFGPAGHIRFEPFFGNILILKKKNGVVLLDKIYTEKIILVEA